jgi:POT family proton-dependent oligopeptide transporter
MVNARRPSENDPEAPSRARGIYQSLTAVQSPSFNGLCCAILCERWAAFTLISTTAAMLCERYGFTRPDSLRICGLFSAACYIGSVPGGHLLDRSASPSRGFTGSLLLLVLGYVFLAIPYRAAAFAGFAVLATGHAFYKPSTQRVLTTLFPTKDSRLEGAQVMLHIAINVGAAAGSFLAGIMVRSAGWSVSYAFSALMVGIGMALSTAQSSQSVPSQVPSTLVTPSGSTAPLLGSLSTILAVLAAMFLLAITTAQAEGALLLWSEHSVRRVILGFELPTAWFVAYAAVLVLVLSPMQLVFLSKRKLPSTTNRLVAVGLVSAALCFAILLPTTLNDGSVSILWPITTYTLFVFAEMLIAPLGLALLHRNSPQRLIGLVTGLWYGAGALGYFVSGHIGALWSKWPTQRVLILLSVLPLIGAALVWNARSDGVQESEI